MISLNKYDLKFMDSFLPYFLDVTKSRIYLPQLLLFHRKKILFSKNQLSYGFHEEEQQ